MGDFGTGREGVHGQIPHVLGILDRHMDQEIVASSQVVDRKDLRQSPQVFPEGFHLGAAVLAEPDRDKSLKPDAQGGGRHFRMGLPQDARRSKTLRPA